MKRWIVVISGMLLLIPAVLHAQFDLVKTVSQLLSAECVTQQQMFQIVNQIFGDCTDNPSATDKSIVAAFAAKGFIPKDFIYQPEECVTKGLLSQILYRALHLRPNFIEWLKIVSTGLNPNIATRVAQRHCVMVRGTSEEKLTGREFVACIIAVTQAELLARRLPCGRFGYHLGELRMWFEQFLKIMSEDEVAVYIPCFVVTPTS